MAVKIRRSYKGAAVSAVLDSSGVTSATQTAITLSTSPSTWPTGKFFAVFAPGTAQEEKMCVTLSGAVLTVVDPAVTSTSASANGRGVDNTTARSTIAGGSAVYPVYTAVDADEANELTSTYAAQGQLVYQGASTFTALSIGTAGQVLKVNSGATAPEWGQVATAGITDNAVTLAKLASAVANALVPVGTITAYAGTTAPTGWLMCDGTAVNAGTYPLLANLVGSTTPDLRGRFPLGDSASLTLLATGGSTTISEANLPSHTHTFSATSGAMSANSTLSHSVTDPGHTHTINGQEILSGLDTVADALQAPNDPSPVAYTENTASNTTGISIANHTVSHTHDVSGTTGGTGSGTAYYQPHVVVNFIIKHD